MRLEPYCRACGTKKIALTSGILRCPKCRKEQGRNYYHQSSERRQKQRAGYVMRRYGKSLADLERMLAGQEGCCGICRRHWSQCVPAKRSRYEVVFLQFLHIDHDHATGAVRGLLCNNCNAGIALFAEDRTRLERACAYLESHGK